MRFVRNNQHHVLFHRLTLPEQFNRSRRRWLAAQAHVSLFDMPAQARATRSFLRRLVGAIMESGRRKAEEFTAEYDCAHKTELTAKQDLGEWKPPDHTRRIVWVTKGGAVVAKSTSREYQRMSPGDQRRFDGWLKANAILGFILFLGMLAMALTTTITTPTSSSVAAGVSKQFAD
jgi:hypothetical protein